MSEFLYMTAGLEGKTLTAKNFKKIKRNVAQKPKGNGPRLQREKGINKWEAVHKQHLSLCEVNTNHLLQAK